MAVETSDSKDRWLVTLGTERVTAERGSVAAQGADCTVRGAASDVYLTLWNRMPVGTVSTEGDAGVLAGFCDKLHIRWT